jgi:hypothetical protein
LTIVDGMNISRSPIVLVLIVVLSQSAAAQVHQRHVRPIDELARVLLELGRDRSDLFRSLAATIEDSDVIVYLQTSETVPRSMDGRLQWAAAVQGARYLRITVRCDLPLERLVALVGHELMHAVEIARERDVRNPAGLRALYLRIGHSDDGATFDTRGAVHAGAHVLAELRRGRATVSRSAQ